MDEKKQFLTLLKAVRHQLTKQHILKEGQQMLVYSGCVLLIFLIIARFIVLPFLLRYFFILIGVLCLIFMFRIWKRRPNLYDAAAIYNKFVPDDRVITAMSFLQEDGLIKRLQLIDTIDHMKKQQQTVLKRKKQMFNFRYLLVGGVLISIVCILTFFPNEKMNIAKQKTKELQLIKKNEKELVTIEKKITDSIAKGEVEKARKEISKHETADEALTELVKQTNELQLKELKEKEKGEELQKWQQQLDEAGLSELSKAIVAKDAAQVKNELEKLKKREDLNNEQKSALNQFSKMENGKIGQQVSAMQKKIDEALQADERMASLSAVQKELVAQAENLKQEMVANGLNPTTTNLSSSSQRYGKNQENDSKDSGANEHIGTEKESESGNETSSNAKKENESGNETDSLKAEKESSNSNKEGISSQIENSNEKGSELDANSQHLLTFPERITGDHHIKEDFGSFEKGQEQQAENDELVLKGSIRPYEEVYGQYEEAYRESINRMKLPHDLEDIVKAYFLNVDPNKE